MEKTFLLYSKEGFAVILSLNPKFIFRSRILRQIVPKGVDSFLMIPDGESLEIVRGIAPRTKVTLVAMADYKTSNLLFCGEDWML